jgi:2-keto-4-pentenoate hydratase
MKQDVVTLAARRLRDAESHCVACDPVRDLIAAGDIDTAYAVQSANVALGFDAGRRIAGRKVGLTNPAVQAQLGVDQPDFGVLFADMAVDDGDAIALSSMIAPRVEAEVAFVIGTDLTYGRATAADVLRATEFVLPAIEVVDSRIRDWDISIVDTVADNGSSGRYVLGTTPHRLTDVDVRAVTMTIVRDGSGQVSAGSGAACLGNPVNAVVWLANALGTRGEHLRAGDVVLSGALGPMARVEQPGRYEADVVGLGTVRVAFS